MTKFVRMQDGTLVALTAVRTIKYGETEQVEIEFTDGSTRTFPPLSGETALDALDALAGPIIPAAAGWRLAFYDGIEDQVEYSGIPAFKVQADGSLRPLTITGWHEPEFTAVVDPQGRFIDPHGPGLLGRGPPLDEAGFMNMMRKRHAPAETTDDDGEDIPLSSQPGTLN